MKHTEFAKQVLEIVAQLDRGELMTYSQVAATAGSPRAYRAVGNILNRNYREREWQLPLEDFSAQGGPASGWEPIPCHRVIRSDGHVGGFARGNKDKIRLLELEGHVINNGRIRLPKIT